MLLIQNKRRPFGNPRIAKVGQLIYLLDIKYPILKGYSDSIIYLFPITKIIPVIVFEVYNFAIKEVKKEKYFNNRNIRINYWLKYRNKKEAKRYNYDYIEAHGYSFGDDNIYLTKKEAKIAEIIFKFKYRQSRFKK